jgi:hypothetical protein
VFKNTLTCIPGCVPLYLRKFQKFPYGHAAGLLKNSEFKYRGEVRDGQREGWPGADRRVALPELENFMCNFLKGLCYEYLAFFFTSYLGKLGMRQRILRSCSVFSLLLLAAGCSQQPQLPISVAVNPQSTAMATGQTVDFTAMVTNDTTGVTWTATAGTIDANGNYTAPSGTQSMTTTVTATSKKDPTKSASATVNVVAPGQVTSTANVQVALYTVSPAAPGNVSVQFGLDTNYGLTTWEQPVPQGGGAVSLFVAGMKGGTLYHMRGMVKFGDGTQFTDADQTFTTGTIPADQLPPITVTTTAGMTPQSGVELLDLISSSTTIWNEFDHLDVNRQPMGFPDWTHSNAVLYSPDDGNLIVSIRHQNWVVKVDYQNGAGPGDILWKLGYQGDFTLVEGTDPIDWFYAQHGPSFVTTNTTGKFSMILFDNGNDRLSAPDVPCGTSGPPPCGNSTVPLLEIDETAKTATLGFHPMAQSYSFFGGNAAVLKNGNVEYCESAGGPGSSGDVYEVTQDSSAQVVWHMLITGLFAYRGQRLPSLYPGVQW